MFMKLSVSGFTSQEVGGVWIFEPSLGVVSDTIRRRGVIRLVAEACLVS